MSLMTMYFLGFSMIYILLTWSIYLPYRVGHLHFLNVATMSITAYFSAISSIRWGWGFFPILFVGILLGALISYIISHAIGDAPTFTVVIVGVTFIFIIQTVIKNTDYLGGTIGYFGLPLIDNLLPILFISLLLTGIILYRIDYSKLGRAASLIFTQKEVALSLGINIKSLGMFFQVVSGSIAGMAGVFYAFLVGSLFPDFFSFPLVGTLMTILFIGGYTTMWGTLFSSLLLGGIPIFLPSSISSWRVLIYGVLLVSIILIRPKGLVTRKMVWRIGEFTKNKIPFLSKAQDH